MGAYYILDQLIWVQMVNELFSDNIASIFQLFKAEGAIPFVKTNNPHTLIRYESTNYILAVPARKF